MATKEIPLGQPTLREWELDSSSTRYDRLRAAPSDDALFTMWLIWAVMTFLAFAFLGTIMLSILLSRRARKNPFNIYLLFLLFSDFIFSLACCITCSLNASAGHYFAPWMCRFQSFYSIWSVCSSFWLNAVVVRQLHLMLTSSFVRRRYNAPTPKQVVCQSIAVYVYATFIASIGILDASWLPHRSDAVSGLACLPVDYSRGSTLFFFLVFFPAFGGVPFVYAVGVSIDIWRRQLMPPTGKRRLLTMYYMRVMAAFVVMWVPFVITVFFVAGGRPWLSWFGGAWAHLQGPVSGVFVLMKPDITQAYKQLMCCIDLKLAGSSRFSLESTGSSMIRRLSSIRRIANKERTEEEKVHSTAGLMNLEDDSSSIGIVFEKDSNKEHADESRVEQDTPQVVSAAGGERKESDEEILAEDHANGFLPVQESGTYTFADEEPVIEQGTDSWSSSSNAV
jgi:hypothetical protein